MRFLHLTSELILAIQTRFDPCRRAGDPNFGGLLRGLRMLLLVVLGSVGVALPVGAQVNASQQDGASRPPNIIFIVLDTTRADRMSHNGYRRLTSANIDAFARDGVTYHNAHSVAPWTLPSHMSMFTGLLPGQHGATWHAFGRPENMSYADIIDRTTFSFSNPAQLLPARLKELGYFTVGFSSNPWVAKRTGFDHGFDAFYEMWRETYALRKVYNRVPPRLRALFQWLSNGIRGLSEMDVGDAGHVLLKLREHLVTHGSLREPFFLFINFIDPHFPYAPPLSWRYAYSDDIALGQDLALGRFDERSLEACPDQFEVSRFSPFYDAEISYVDYVVGRLFTWLREQGYYDDALILVTSDHGEHLGEGGRFSHQLSVEEELLHVPLVIKYPGFAQRGREVYNPLVSNIDVYETILRAASNGPPPGGPSAFSHDLKDMDAFDRSFLIAEYDYSLPRLRAYREKCPEFPIDEHRVTRRVVYDGRRRHVFLEWDRVAPAAASTTPDEPGREAAGAFLQGYLRSLPKKTLPHGSGAPLDKATRDRLRALGYAN